MWPCAVVTGVELAHLEDAGLQADDPLHGIWTALQNPAAIQRDAGPHEIVVVLGSKKDAARIGETGGGWRQLGAQLIEAHALGAVHGMRGLVGASEVAHDERELEMIEQGLLCCQGADLVCWEAEAIDACVDVHGRTQPPTGGIAERRPFPDFAEAAEAGPQIEAGIVAGSARQQPVQHVNCGAGLDIADAARFRQRGHEECFAPLIAQRMSDFLEPQPIGVGLDDASAFRFTRDLVQLAPVGPQRREIDREDSACFGGNGAVTDAGLARCR